MRVLSLLVIAGIGLSGCASAKKLDVKNTIDVRAATMVEQQTIDLEAERTAADNYYAEGNFKAALRAYQNVILHASEDYEHAHLVLMGYGDSALALGGHEAYRRKAEKAYSVLAEFEDLSEEIQDRLLSGQVLLEIAKNEDIDVEVRLNEALETNLGDPRLWNALGRLHDQNQDWLIALETYVKALHVANKEGYPVAPVINNMGMSYMLQKRTADALKKFEQAHALNPDIHVYDNNRRLALILTDRIDQAVDGLTDKRAALIYNDAGYLSAATGKKARAQYLYKKAIELSPSYFEKAEINLSALQDESIPG